MFLVLALCTGVAALVAEDVGRWVLSGATTLLVLASIRFFRLAAAWPRG